MRPRADAFSPGPADRLFAQRDQARETSRGVQPVPQYAIPEMASPIEAFTRTSAAGCVPDLGRGARQAAGRRGLKGGRPRAPDGVSVGSDFCHCRTCLSGPRATSAKRGTRRFIAREGAYTLAPIFSPAEW